MHDFLIPSIPEFVTKQINQNCMAFNYIIMYSILANFSHQCNIAMTYLFKEMMRKIIC